ncbi:hypothetical protein GUK36_35120 [Rhizobium leguminosarum]|uniref:Uncharacterized protein n=1 Tax=Rhizobium leguminosarum TaxID=384 RepID=A0A6P0DNI6_RHILE|nr:hypothetical protein [Rhizobium leguminosarum]NEK54594.1 hypothetical protein [Rhizobium leguminosarum]
MGSEPGQVTYTAHSVVRGMDGELFDITPLYNNYEHRGQFIPHVGDEATFSEMKRDAFIFLTCQGNLPAVPLDPMLTRQQDYTLPSEDSL